MIVNATGRPSRDTILDDIIYYIDNNFRNNIKLEGIAPLFGYSSTYLGKSLIRPLEKASTVMWITERLNIPRSY